MAAAHRMLFLLLIALPCLLPAQATVALTAAPNPASNLGATVALIATVTPSSATGRIAFYDGVTILGTKSLVSGAAAFTTNALPFGTRKLRAWYAGDSANAAATSNVVTQTVNARPSAGFSTAAKSAIPASILAASGDFNADGAIDLVTLGATGASSTMTVLLGDGAGNFSGTPATVPSGYRGTAAAADFNLGGKLDLAIVGAAGLNILLGNGDGTFQPALVTSFANPLLGIAAGDFNADGIADLALADAATGVNVLLGKGDGTFQAAVAYTTNPQAPSNQANCVLLGDFNGDGKADLAAANSGSATLSILLGKGDGTFQAAALIAIPAAALSLTTADFNGDGKPDLATNTGAILIGNGDGTFRQPVTSTVDPNPTVGVGDFNGDGTADLVFSGGSSQLTLLYGRSDGTFQPAATYPIGPGGSPVLVGEFNNDGKTDLAFTNGSLVLLLGTTVTAAPTGGTPQSTPTGAAFGTPLQVTVKDGANPVSGVTVTFSAPSTGPSAAFSSPTAVTNANGVASVTATANSQSGAYTVTASALGVPALFFLSNLAGPLTTLTATGGTPQQTLVGTAFAKPLSVKLADSSGLAASGVPVTFSAPFNGPTAILSAITVFTDAAGIATVTATANSLAGNFSVTARAGGLSAVFALTNLQGATLTLGTSANPGTLGVPLHLTVTLANSAATGRVTFFDGVNVLGTSPVVSGVASLSTIALAAGSHKLTAYYRDDVTFVAGTSNTLIQTVRTFPASALALQPPIGLSGVPKSAVVGDFNNDGKADVAAPAQDTGSWWQVDLGAPAAIGSVVVWNRTDCCGDRLSDYWIFVSNTPFDPSDTPATLQNRAGTFASRQISAPAPSAAIQAGGAPGQYVRVQLTNPGILSLAEVQVFGTGAQSATNLALRKPASQSSTYPGYAAAAAASAVDGNTDGSFFNNSVTSTSQFLVSILLGKGDSTFQPTVTYGTLSTTMASADFNGDGNADLVLLNIANSIPTVGSATVMLGNGDGAFRQGVTYQAGVLFSGTVVSPASGIAVADFNSDGKPDILIGASYASGSLLSGTVMVLLPGNGDGSFGAPIAYTPVFVPFVVADLNGDSAPDLAGLKTFPGSGPNFFITLGNGNGTSQPTVGTNLAVGATLLVAGDFNGDGITDLALNGVSGASSNTVATTFLALGKGDGTFQPLAAYPLGATAAAGDLNGDGFLDLVVTDSNGNTTGLLLGNGDGTFRQGFQIPAGAPLAVADFNSDGRADVFTTSASGVSILLGSTGVATTVTATGGTPQSAAVGTAFAVPLQIKVVSNGVPVAGAAVAFAAPPVGASAVLSSPTATTNASGIASVTATANNIAGSYAVTATYGVTTASFSLTNTTFAFLVSTGGTPQSTPVGTPFATALQATVKNSVGNPISGITVSFSVPTVGASAILSSPTAVTNASGIATVTATANNVVGSYTVTASAGSLSTSFALTNQAAASSNLALGKTATQSSTFPSPLAAAAGAVDGNTDGRFSLGTVTATNQEPNAWWQVDLGASASITSIILWNRTDCCGSRLSDYWVFVSDTPFLPTDNPVTLQNRAGTFANHQTSAPNPSTTLNVTVQGRYVRVQLAGTDYLSLAEVQVIGTGAPAIVNVAQGKLATQSSTLPGFAGALAASAVDGNTSGNFFLGSVTATNPDANAWWQVDLGASAALSSIVAWNRTDCCGSRLSDYWVFVSDTPFLATDTPATLQNRASTFASHQTSAPNPSMTITAAVQGRYIRVQLSGSDYLSLAEVQVFGVAGQGPPPASNLSRGKPAAQISTLAGSTATASLAVDGDLDGNYFAGSVTATNLDPNPWWQVDLGASASVSSIAVYNRTDCCGSRLTDYWVFVSDTPFLATDTPATLQNRAGTYASHQTSAPNPVTTIPTTAQGRYVRVQLSSGGYLSLAEVQVFGQ